MFGVLNQTSGVFVTGGSLGAQGGITGMGGLTVKAGQVVSPWSAPTVTVVDHNLGRNGDPRRHPGTSLPANSVLAVNGGTLDLHGNNISLSNITDTTAGGVITNNGAAASVSKITFVGSNSQDYNLFATLNDGTGNLAFDTSITNLQTNGVPARIVHFHSTGTYTGGTTVRSQSIQAEANNQCVWHWANNGLVSNNASTNWSQVYVQRGVAIHNDITIAQGLASPGWGPIWRHSVCHRRAGGDADVFGNITIQANNVDGGLFFGAPLGGVDFLNIHNAVNVAGTADTVIQNGGQVRYFGGGNYQNFQLSGTAQSVRQKWHQPNRDD